MRGGGGGEGGGRGRREREEGEGEGGGRGLRLGHLLLHLLLLSTQLQGKIGEYLV